ncbi:MULTISPECIES: MurR/RpiR family transcriptional regulator [Thalassospira]|uniref:Transcriptional regulator, RpiR family n=3 Tax=Thalassospira TaxID=168934 RepID=A0A285R686_9PROT|nr:MULTISPECIES: MurR/RpiR family transcriptional regulator [Thalassospira]AJD52312.1 RpiR family transcriptional regulator [Thalassospira xiamenensis M-5 = DSM 17429]KEO53732.1 RpiR family transcriptional regulator [Thalassospira permensis NBRC 106175]MAB31700.1 MurR/RpiR family transcriptional regulator [Thalassospira sp.]MBA05037.1 MurR/RpiR family transcriptional regulator [Thalassospira sp.]MDM7975661.1 MurR/RpiR family transcriptional regulator [Thalassospira xiamenensis]|tara:strand:+ start:504 stop:1388 length:885 start_codon:yes stop_codon:yes gene_type:complete
MQPTVDIISLLRRKAGTFPAREQRVADYVQDHLQDVTTIALSDLAQKVGVSEPTVIRFCRTLGCDGFRDFKIRLAQNLAVSMQYLAPEDLADDTTAADVLSNHVLGVIVDNLRLLRDQLSSTEIDKAADILANARQIAFMGVGGGSTTVAFDAANRFFRLGIPAQAQSDGYLQRMLASTFGEEDVLFAISTSGRPTELIHSAAIARQYGAKVISMTHPQSPLAAESDLVIGIDMPENPDIYKPTATRHVFLATIDIIATAVARRTPDRTLEKLRRIRSSLLTLNPPTGRQPIGD